ncbi:YCII-related protein [Catenulispora acidiphila DSM 44928]|uniref:YCII-related protein n=1 Tax=Catenulispora acidiphila (strain DSM 44928 / JCM 14897 / NBRC 102108 / NRRL B-24433 / ID139908) TaxID=479433 RepID=C7QEX9_CATAD|nr:YciI family protein [Catenulispora acidiphila]ACU74737.1 YCII-related protein [Catenulispora acidiphila DSM 44928]
MDFFCYHRDRADSLALRMELLEDHWSYMDGFAQEMIARGPTVEGDDGSDGDGGDDGAPTGSVHILTLPDAAAARTFAFEEPGYQAGVYRDVMLRRWRNDIGRTMWDFPGGAPENDGYLVLALGPAATRPVADTPKVPDAAGLIAFGPLLSDDGEQWLGTIALLRAPSPDEARATAVGAEEYAEIEVHQWRFGGRS